MLCWSKATCWNTCGELWMPMSKYDPSSWSRNYPTRSWFILFYPMSIEYLRSRREAVALIFFFLVGSALVYFSLDFSGPKTPGSCRNALSCQCGPITLPTIELEQKVDIHSRQAIPRPPIRVGRSRQKFGMFWNRANSEYANHFYVRPPEDRAHLI